MICVSIIYCDCGAWLCLCINDVIVRAFLKISMKSSGGLILLFGMIIYLIVNIGIYILIAAVVGVIIWLALSSLKSTPSNNDLVSKKITENEILDETNNDHNTTLKRVLEPVVTLVTSNVSDSVVGDNIHLKEFNILNDFFDKLLAVNSDSFSQNIANRIRSYQQSFPNSTCSKDSLYVHIIDITNNTIEISRHSIDKDAITRECKAINYIIKQLQNNTPYADIIDNFRQEQSYFQDAINQDDFNKTTTLTSLECNSVASHRELLVKQQEDLKICVKSMNDGIKFEKQGDLNNAINHYIKSSEKAKSCASYINFHKAQMHLADAYRKKIDYGNELVVIEETTVFLSSIGHPLRYWNERLISLNSISENNHSQVIHLKRDNNGVAEVINAVLASHSQSKELKVSPMYTLPVYPWSHFYVYSADDINKANDKQKKFYYYFKSEFLRNNCIDIEDNWNYAFVLMFDLLEDYKRHNDINKIQEQLTILGANYPKTSKYTKQALNRAIYNEPTSASAFSINVNISNILSQFNNEPSQSKEKLTQKCKWIDEGKDIEIEGIKLKKGNFYLGEKFLLPEEYRRYWNSDSPYLYASVLNPKLPFSSSDESSSAKFSSYTNMTPYWRWQYLQWLSGNVPVEDVSLDILFLYLHGLEIKMFIDEKTTDNQRSIILKNVIKLKNPVIERAGISDYGIKSFFNEFIDCAITKYFPSTPLEYVSEAELNDYRAYKSYILEQTIGDKRAISCDFAYNLALNTLDFGKIVPPKYSNHLKSRFDHHFKNQHPRGLRISRSGGASRHYYSIMSRNITNKAFESEHRYISSEIYESKFNTWEISNAIEEPCRAIEREFASYNRFIVDNEGKENLFAIFTLPNYINISAEEKVITFKKVLETNFVNKKHFILEVNELLMQWEYSRKEEKTLHKKYVDAIIEALHVLGYGIAPNYNIDKKRFNFNDKVVLYQNSERAKVSMNNIYARMEVFVKMAVQIIYSNDTTIEDRIFIDKHIANQVDYEINQKQLAAYLEWLLLGNQRFDAKLKDIIPLLFNESQRINTCDVLVELCCVGGIVNSKRVDVVKKVLSSFGIDSSDIHSRIHRIFTGETDNFVTIEKQSNATEFTIPRKENVKPKFYIDTNKLSEIEKETQESQKILSEIFNNDEVSSIIKVAATPNTDIEILHILLTKESWNRSEVETICKERGLMIGSMLEKLNDYAYDKVNDAVIDDAGEIIYVTIEYKEQLI